MYYKRNWTEEPGGLQSMGSQRATRLLCPWNFPGKTTGVSCHFLLQGSFPTQGSKLHLCSPALAGRFFPTAPPEKPRNTRAFHCTQVRWGSQGRNDPPPGFKYQAKLIKLISRDQLKGPGNFLVVQWLGLCAFTAEGPAAIPGQGTRILQVACYGQKKERKKTDSPTQVTSRLKTQDRHAFFSL